MSGTAFPPAGPTTLVSILKAYVYKQYEDDDNIQAFNTSFNDIAQQYMTYLAGLNLPVYTQQTGALLDWVANGIYGEIRPVLQSGATSGIGPLNTYGPNTAGVGLNVLKTAGSITTYAVNDDIFKRIITWNFFKGDGLYFSIAWLKRRIMRFLTCPNGAAPNIDSTYPISVAYGASNTLAITITISGSTSITLLNAKIFAAALMSGALQVPFQYAYAVSIVEAYTSSGLQNVGGVVNVVIATGWPTSATGLSAGALWDAGGVAFVVPTTTPSPTAAPVYFSAVTSASLLALGGANMPLVDPRNSGQLWNNGGILCVSLGV